MLNALLHIPVKILLSVAGALLTLNFATFVTKYIDNHDNPIIAERIECRHAHEHDIMIHFNQAEEERARVLVLEGLNYDVKVQADLKEMSEQIERLDIMKARELEKTLMIYR
jgi:uncharacterized Fe-S cluster-containing protein